MKSTLRLALGLIAVSSACSLVACGDDDASGGSESHGGNAAAGQGQGGVAENAVDCEVIGELCHEADTGAGPAHDCHETGHIGNASACGKAFNSCISLCVSIDEGVAGAASSGEDARCAALGELCHPVDDQTGPLHACHELGHEGDAAACAASYTECATRCLAARAALEPESAVGGAAGASSVGSAGTSSGGAGGNR